VSQAAAPALRIARFAAVPEPPIKTAAPAVGRDAETVRAIQVELAAQGFGPVPRDGSLSVATRAAVMAYEYDHGLPLTATPNAELLQRLLLGAPDAGDRRAQPEVATPAAEQVVASAQRALADLGYLAGPGDGQLTAETGRAIREFEVDRGMVPRVGSAPSSCASSAQPRRRRRRAEALAGACRRSPGR
jgi:peptidoglycan hydrolase-like protein with peptidoglycan-binding domain